MLPYACPTSVAADCQSCTLPWAIIASAPPCITLLTVVVRGQLRLVFCEQVVLGDNLAVQGSCSVLHVSCYMSRCCYIGHCTAHSAGGCVMLSSLVTKPCATCLLPVSSAQVYHIASGCSIGATAEPGWHFGGAIRAYPLQQCTCCV